ncbi:MAG: hypothetical protein JNK68_09240 [Betaproteobacteria bacterium]|nr:hypothetical protein [Betaproteobacteria bacterium]
MSFVKSRIAVAAISAFPLVAAADTKAPQAQYWVDVATNNSSIPGMPGGLGGIVGSMMGMAGGPQQSLNLWLYSRNAKPASPEATHDIPQALNMGPTLPLVLPTVEKKTPSPEEEGTPGKIEKPKARMLFYWGCGEAVRPGQPKVADTEKMSLVQFGQTMKGRSAPERGPWGPGRAVWPNQQDNRPVPAGASLQGDHLVHGNYTPEIKFKLGQQQDFMAPVQLVAQGSPAESVRLEWQAIPTATGYFLMALGHRSANGEMIVWTSSEVQDSGFGLMSYLPNDFVRKLITEKVILPPSTQTCAIPKGIFEGSEGTMVRMIAYGEELNLAYPPRPADAKANWEPIWTAKVRVKSEGMAFLGMGDAMMRHGGGSERGVAPPAGAPEQESGAGSRPVDPVKEGVDALKKLLPF